METAQGTSRYRVEMGQWQDEPVVILSDNLSGAQATIAGGIGANCVAWAITKADQPVAVLETPPTPDHLRTRKFKAGIPILWPFPGRVRNAQYSFDGREYHLPITDKGGVHHIHGLVISAAWQSGPQGTSEAGVWAEFGFSPADLSDEERAGYPFDFELTARYTLADRSLTLSLTVANHGQTDLPFGYGLHPYFHAPLQVSQTTPDRSACPVLIPASRRWPTQDGLPTGEPEPLAPPEDFESWRPLGSQPFDHMYSQVHFDGDWTTGGFRDPGAGLEVLVQADQHFREWVLFTQPNRPSLCIEPYTCPPNSINFTAEGLTNDGLIRLSRGASWQGVVKFEVNDLAS